uniref:Uncharacterized protein n=1 Tax=Chromera velia CCMP2878 TaxID=1169474 RepID=A0A0G4F0T7_9ALVE|eukprot:Cvel_14630.t1-p1 / transcript=Cvel_14630.t1 / gene=Cvel_14630 / organism=Chromera_velia_CCMP2878 / gene_product=hypothetical protein / transcript_product=hypothetical protein / location=Cvel_scaffold1047:6075-14396(-) / protein_length=644 / sequence_SO=supercontig / SO=protein_coding / is_pseudo=false
MGPRDPTTARYHVNRDAYGLFCFCEVKDTKQSRNPFARSRVLVQVFCVLIVCVQVLAMMAVSPAIFNLKHDKEHKQQFTAAQGGILAYIPFSNIPMHAQGLSELISSSTSAMIYVDAIAVAVFAFRMVPEINGHIRCLIVGLAQGSEKDPSRPRGSAFHTPLGSPSAVPLRHSYGLVEGERGGSAASSWSSWKWRLKRWILIVFLGFFGCLVMPVSLLLTGSTMILQSEHIGDTLLNSIKSIFIADIDNYLVDFLVNFAPVNAFNAKGSVDTEMNKKEFQFRVPLTELEAIDVKGQIFRYQMTLYPLTFGFGLVPWILCILKQVDSEIPDISSFWGLKEERQTRPTVEFGCAFFSVLLGSIVLVAVFQLLFVLCVFGLESFEWRLWRLHMIREFYELLVKKEEPNKLRSLVDGVKEAMKSEGLLSQHGLGLLSTSKEEVERVVFEAVEKLPPRTLTRQLCTGYCNQEDDDEEGGDDGAGDETRRRILENAGTGVEQGEGEGLRRGSYRSEEVNRRLDELVQYYTDNYISAFMRFLADPLLSIPLMLLFGVVNIVFFACVVINKHHEDTKRHEGHSHTIEQMTLHISIVCIGVFLSACNFFLLVVSSRDKTMKMVSPRIDKHFIVLLSFFGTLANVVLVISVVFF